MGVTRAVCRGWPCDHSWAVFLRAGAGGEQNIGRIFAHAASAPLLPPKKVREGMMRHLGAGISITQHAALDSKSPLHFSPGGTWVMHTLLGGILSACCMPPALPCHCCPMATPSVCPMAGQEAWGWCLW